MIPHYDIIQGSSKWFEIKHGKIGGTRAACGDALIYELAAERSESYAWEEGYTSDAMLRGQDLEPVAIERLEEYTGLKFNACGWIESDIENVGISPDGITEDETVMCEIKCLGGKKHIETCLSDTVPLDYIRQVLHYFVCNHKLERMYFVSFRPESLIRPLYVKELTRDSLVDIGLSVKTKVKEDRGLGVKEYVATIQEIRTVREWVEYARERLIETNAKVDAVIEQLKF